MCKTTTTRSLLAFVLTFCISIIVLSASRGRQKLHIADLTNETVAVCLIVNLNFTMNFIGPC